MDRAEKLREALDKIWSFTLGFGDPISLTVNKCAKDALDQDVLDEQE
jgi:hypothetical protein